MKSPFEFSRRQAIFGIAFAAILVSAWLGVSAWPGEAAARSGDAAGFGDASSSLEAATTYTCPMHPEVDSDKPGKCPKCGMKLVPKPPANGSGST
jgi:hypothetical protein